MPKISRKRQGIERKRRELYTCARLYSVAEAKRTRGNHWNETGERLCKYCVFAFV